MAQRQPLTAAGRQTTIHLATRTEPAPAGVLVLHPWWGLTDDVIAYADRLAQVGFAVAAPDLYGGPTATTIEEAERLSDGIDEAAADAWALAAVDRLVAAIDAPEPRIATVGFSMGGAWALWLAAQRPEVVGTVVYYGSLEGPSLSRARTPVMGHFAESDPYEPDEAIDTFEATLRRAGREVEIHRYPGAGHWFAEPSRDAYVGDAAETAFGRTIEFLQALLVGTGVGRR